MALYYLLIFLLIILAIAISWYGGNMVTLWVKAMTSSVPFNPIRLILMRIKGIPEDIVVNNMIRATKAGIKVSIEDLENHYQAKGNLPKVIDALITARNASIPLDFNAVRQIDLAGRDVNKVLGALITAKNSGLPLEIATAARIDLSGRDVEKVVRAVVTARNANIDLPIEVAAQIDLSGRDVFKVLSNVIQARNAGINLQLEQAIQIDLSGRDLQKVVSSIISAQNAGLDLDLETAVQIDRTGRDIEEAVRNAVQTKIVESPADRPIKALPKDGVEVIFMAYITVRTNINGLLSGAGGDDTLLARVEQKLVSKISSMNTYAEVLQHPTDIANILEPTDGKKRSENALGYLDSGIKKWEERSQNESILKENRNILLEKGKEEEEIYHEIEKIRSSEQDYMRKIEEEIQRGGDTPSSKTKTELEILEGERRRLELERGKMEMEVKKLTEEQQKISENNRKITEQIKRWEDDAHRDFDHTHKESALALQELSESIEVLNTAQSILEEIYTELNSAYTAIYKAPDSTKQEIVRKGLETANREMDLARAELDTSTSELRRGRDELKIAHHKHAEVIKKMGGDEKVWEIAMDELNHILKKLEESRRQIISARLCLSDALNDLDDGFKTLVLLAKRLGVVQSQMESIRKKINVVRRDLNPARKALEENTIYHVISVEIKNLIIGKDRGAELELEQLKADAERKRQNVAMRTFELDIKKKEVELKEMEAKHKMMEAEAKVNEALADAFKAGNLGALDFYRLKNLQADTRMRNSLSGDESEEKHN